MYAVGREHPLKEEARAFFRSQGDTGEPLATSAEVLQGLLHAYVPVNRLDALDAALLLVTSRTGTIWSLDAEDALLARQLVAKHPGLRARDLRRLPLSRYPACRTTRTPPPTPGRTSSRARSRADGSTRGAAPHGNQPSSLQAKSLERRSSRLEPRSDPSGRGSFGPRKSALPEAGAGTRTPDLLITNQLLYQLSYASARSQNVARAALEGQRKRWKSPSIAGCNRACSARHGHDPRQQLNRLPEIAQAQVLVGPVLIVVMIHQRHAHRGDPPGLR